MPEGWVEPALLLAAVALVWRMFERYDRRGEERSKDLDRRGEERSKDLDRKNERAHAQIGENINRLTAAVQQVAVDVARLAGRQEERDLQRREPPRSDG